MLKAISNLLGISQSQKVSTKQSASLFNEVAIENVLYNLSKLDDPDLILSKLGMGRHELRKMETDDEISAALETRRDAVISTPWRLENAESDVGAWLWELLSPHVLSILRESWNAVPYGYSVLEAVYERTDNGLIVLSSIREKPMEWFEPLRDGGLRYTAPMSGSPILVDNVYKFFTTIRNPTYRNPYGEALLSRAYWPWFFRHNGWSFWMRFLERFADPLLLGQVDDPVSFVKQMTQLGLEAVVGVGREEQVTAVTSPASGEFEKLDQALSRRIQKLILGQTLTTDVGKTGSFAAARVHNEVRNDKRISDIRVISGTIQRIINAIWALNGFAFPSPVFVMEDDTGIEAARADRDAKLAQYNIVKFTDQYLLDRYDFNPGDFTIPENAPSITPPPQNASLTLGALRRSPRSQRFTEDQQLVEELVDSSLELSMPIIPPDTLKRAILAAESPDDLVTRLAEIYQGADAREFRELLDRALFTADVLGYVTAEKRIGV